MTERETKPEDVLAFWLDEVGEQGWYAVDEALDATIRTRFEDTWRAAAEGAHALWLTYPSGALAYLILVDQFPRNMFRGTARAFATDRIAVTAAKQLVDRGWDLRIDEPARQFFYMPLMHSESLCDQERAVRLILTRMPEAGAETLRHAKAHREVIRKFGRFPYRNEALARQMSAPEEAFVANGGYGRMLEAV
ncbi:MAG: DUF924 family protein [Shimia sp.]